jgi:hypothetical protein
MTAFTHISSKLRSIHTTCNTTNSECIIADHQNIHNGILIGMFTLYIINMDHNQQASEDGVSHDNDVTYSVNRPVFIFQQRHKNKMSRVSNYWKSSLQHYNFKFHSHLIESKWKNNVMILIFIYFHAQNNTTMLTFLYLHGQYKYISVLISIH